MTKPNKLNTGTPIISTQDLQKTYGKGDTAFTALKNVNIVINEGEAVAIEGKSGSGKSTLLHLLALLDTPSKGIVSIGDQNATRLNRTQVDTIRNQQFGFVFQQFFLNANDTVLNNVTLPLKIGGVSSAERKKRGLAALRSVELADKANNKANDLSGGQKQRVAIARALINEPKVIFADEPTGNLDTITGEKIEDLLFELNKKNGITLIFVTHDRDLSKRCERQIFIRDGEIVKTGKS